MSRKKIHYNREVDSNVLLCGALKEPEKLVWRDSEENFYSNETKDVTCKTCLDIVMTGSKPH